MKTFILIVALAACACTTQKRTKANLAIDSEPSAAPAASEESTAAASDEGAPEGEIDLGLEGSSGPVRVEGAMSSEDEDAAIEGAKPAPKKDAKKDKDAKEDASKKKKAVAEADEDAEDADSADDLEVASDE